MNALVPFYASHSLRLGGYRARWVAVRLDPSGGVELRPFTEETERTIFVNGTMILVSPTLPLEEGREELIDFPTLASLIEEHSPWELLLPHEAKGGMHG